MHKYEQSLRNLLLSTLNVRDLDCCTISCESGKYGLQYVVDFAVKLATLFKTSRDLLRSAAMD